MQNKNLLSLKDKPDFMRSFMFTLCLVFILLLIYIVGVLLLTRNNYKVDDTSDSDIYFKDCTILEPACNDTNCGLYTWCGNGAYQTCRIYDCGDNYGIFTRDFDDKMDNRREAKPDMQAISAKQEACSGSMEVLEKNCVDNKMQVKVKLNTADECKIGSFALVYEGEGAKPNNFSTSDDGTYAITAYGCGTISSIVPTTVEGIALSF